MRRTAPACLALLLLAACAPQRPAATAGTPPVATSAPATSAATTPAVTSGSWPTLTLVKAWSGFSQPLFVTASPADPSRVLVVEKGGLVRGVHGGSIDPTPFLDLTGTVSTVSEEGLLSIAFPPGAASASRVYACYTDKSGDVVVSRFAVGADGVAVAASRREVLRVPHSAHPNHNGGEIAFGPDGMLYFGVGDGGSEGDPNGNGQRPGTLLAKLLRIDVEGVAAGGKVPATYLVPSDNPFVGKSGFRPETWAWGLRNPWRFSFDGATGELYIGDVGQDLWEEIDVAPAGTGGQDYGWSQWEGLHPYPPGATRSRAGFTFPVAEYGHDVGDAVIGGYVYRGKTSPALDGIYLFGDTGSGRIWGLRREGGAWRMHQFAVTGLSISSFGEDDAHEVYVTDIAGGAVYRVTAK
jgi:glucose/arabinose dehydrogenase